MQDLLVLEVDWESKQSKTLLENAEEALNVLPHRLKALGPLKHIWLSSKFERAHQTAPLMIAAVNYCIKALRPCGGSVLALKPKLNVGIQLVCVHTHNKIIKANHGLVIACAWMRVVDNVQDTPCVVAHNIVNARRITLLASVPVDVDPIYAANCAREAKLVIDACSRREQTKQRAWGAST
eukprot:3370904-Pleurochrysis_carterae.AAC.1